MGVDEISGNSNLNPDQDPAVSKASSTLSLRLFRKLGSGGFGSVFGVEDVATKRKYALKVISCENRRHLKYARREITIMRDFRGKSEFVV